MPPSDPLRILFVCGTDFTGPSEKQVLWFARELVGRGHPVMISVHGDERTAALEGAADVHALKILWHGYRGRRATRANAWAARRFRPDLIHAWYARPPVAAPASTYARVTGAPVFVHWEDDEWGQLDGLTARSSAERARHVTRRALHRLYPPLWNLATRWSLDWAGRQVAFDAITPELAREVTRRTGRECSVLLPAAPPEAWAGGDTNARDMLPAEVAGRRALLYTGDINFGRAEDFRLGLRAIAAVQRHGHDVCFVHAGRNTAGVDFAGMVHAAGMEPGSAFELGNLPYRRIPGLLRSASILLQPGRPTSFNRYGLPSKLQSYLASGTPCITFAVGAGELLEDRIEVLKTHSGEATELADRIEELLADADLYATLAESGPRAARRLFDPERNTDRLLDHYRGILARNQHPEY